MRARAGAAVLTALTALGAAGLASATNGAEHGAQVAQKPVAAAAPSTADAGARPGVTDARRAKANYLIHCSGCHGDGGVGFAPNVPTLHGPMAKFARTDEGRSYLMRIPGVTQTTLTPAQVAEVLNWALHEFNAPAETAGIRPFTTEEIAAARANPLLEVVEARAKLASQY